MERPDGPTWTDAEGPLIAGGDASLRAGEMPVEEVERKLTWFTQHIHSGGSLSNIDSAALLRYAERLVDLAKPIELQLEVKISRRAAIEAAGEALRNGARKVQIEELDRDKPDHRYRVSEVNP